MHAWEFAKALHLQREHGWARFVSMQDHDNLLAREEEREMIPLCLDEGVGTVVWSPLARGRLARPWEAAKSTARAETDGGYADLLYTPPTEAGDHAIVDAVGVIAEARGASRAQVALAWLHSKPVVTAPLVGANATTQIDEAVASLGETRCPRSGEVGRPGTLPKTAAAVSAIEVTRAQPGIPVQTGRRDVKSGHTAELTAPTAATRRKMSLGATGSARRCVSD